jgi:hypothetical protein
MSFVPSEEANTICPRTQKARRLLFRAFCRAQFRPSAPHFLAGVFGFGNYFTGCFPSTGAGAGVGFSSQQPAKASVIRAEQSNAIFPKPPAVNPGFLLS